MNRSTGVFPPPKASDGGWTANRADGTVDDVSAIEFLADPGVNNFGDTRGGGLAGPTGLFIILTLAVVTVLLIRNMNKRLKRLPERFPHQDAEVSTDRDRDPTS